MHGFVQEEEPPTLITADRPFEKGDVSTVARREGVATWTSVLYIRSELVTVQKNLDSFMNDKTLNQLYITGPSGCGKTSFLYLWARRLSVLQKKRVLIIQFREGQSSFIWIREENGVIWRMNQHIAQSKLQQEVEEIIKRATCKDSAAPFDLCIHDGVLDKREFCTSMQSTLNTAVGNGIIGKVAHIITSRRAFGLSTGGQLLNSTLSTIRQVSFDSWCEEDYRAAVSCKTFMEELNKSAINPFPMDMRFLLANAAPDDAEDAAEEKESMSSSDTPMDQDDSTKGDTTLSDQEVMEAKHFYAGGNARLMFETLLVKLDPLGSKKRRIDQQP